MRNKTTRVHPHNPWRESRAEDRWQPAAAEQRGVLEVGGEGLVASGEDLDEAGELGPSGLARSRSRCKASSSLVIFSSTASSFCSRGLTAVRRSHAIVGEEGGDQHDQRSEEHEGHIHLLGEALSHAAVHALKALVHALKLGVHALLNGLETLVNDFELRLDLGKGLDDLSVREAWGSLDGERNSGQQNPGNQKTPVRNRRSMRPFA